jgi:mycothiol synthase
MPRAWILVDGQALLGSPLAFFDQVLPGPREAYQSQYRRARSALEKGAFDPRTSLFAQQGSQAIGLAIAARSEEQQLEIIAVRQDQQRQGLGRALLQGVLEAARAQGARRLTAQAVSSANLAAVRLLESQGFAGRPQGSLRLRRSLAGPLPQVSAPEGYQLRPLRAKEEVAWVELKNACFPEDRPWTLEDFGKEFLEAPFCEYSRIFVASRGEELAGTASAWEVDLGEGPVGLIHWVGVRPEHRGKGLGEALNALALHELARRGYPDAWLNTSRERRAAVRLYEKMGFALHRELYRYELDLKPAR